MKVVSSKRIFDHGQGLPPGQLTRIDPDHAGSAPTIHLLSYGTDGFEEIEAATPEQVKALLGKRQVCWIHVCGIGNETLIRDLCSLLGIHPLAQEDILNNNAQPKFEEYGSDLFVVTKAASINTAAKEIRVQQVSLYATQTALLSVQENETALALPVIKRVRDTGSRLRSRGVGYLLFALLDVKADSMLSIIDSIENDLVQIEEDLSEAEGRIAIDTIYRLKRTVLSIMRFVMPMRDNAHRLEIIDHPLIRDEDRYFFRDLADNSRRAAERLEHARLLLQNMQEYYHLTEERQNNHVMKVLTVIATLFLPLTFIAGVYGMNFSRESGPWNMPELYSRYGYPLCLLFMAVFFCSMLYWFWRKKWL